VEGLVVGLRPVIPVSRDRAKWGSRSSWAEDPEKRKEEEGKDVEGQRDCQRQSEDEGSGEGVLSFCQRRESVALRPSSLELRQLTDGGAPDVCYSTWRIDELKTELLRPPSATLYTYTCVYTK
jgi:hypothetical protein